LSGPIVFISHLRVKPGKLAEVRALNSRMVEQIDTDKPRTAAFLPYLSEDGTMMTVVHVFADAEAMDLHFAGADDRSDLAYELLEQDGWEIYGDPSAAALATLAAGAKATGAKLALSRQSLGGFLRQRS